MIKENLTKAYISPNRNWLSCIPVFMVLWAIGYLLWTYTESVDANQSRIYPIRAIGHIFQQLSYADGITEWNIPYLSITIWMVWLLGIITLGQWLAVKVTSIRALSGSARLCLYFGLGFVAFGSMQLLFGLVGLLSIPLIGMLLLPLVVSISSSAMRTDLKAILSALSWQLRALNQIQKLILVGFGLAVLLSQIPALTPPIQSDGVRYHLGVPQEYIKNGRIGFLLLNAYSNMPFLVEMHYLAALICKAPETSQLMHFTLALFTMLSIYALARVIKANSESIGPFPFLFVGMLYLAIPCSSILATWAFTDHAISFFLVLSVWSILLLLRTGTYSSALISGVIIGGLMGTKYTMMPLAAALTLLPLFNKARPVNYRINLGLITGISALIIGGVWLSKNAILTGNPFYPLASAVFPSRDWTTECSQFLHDRASSKGIGVHGFSIITVLYHATFHWISSNFETHNIGPFGILAILMALMSIPASTSKSYERKSAIAVLTFVVISFLLWFFSYQSNRLLLPTLALALSLLPIILTNIVHRLRRHAYCALILCAGYGIVWAIQWSLILSPYPSTLRYVTGQVNRKTFLNNALTYSRAYDFLNSNVASTDRVFLIGEHRIYGARFSAYWSDWFDTPILAYIIRKYQLSTFDELLDWLRNNNVRWIMINHRELEPQLDMFKSRLKQNEWEFFQQLSQIQSGSKFRVTNLTPGSTIIELLDNPT